MEPGEFEHRKAFEETTTKNVRTVVDYSTSTRTLVNELADQVKELKNMLVAKDVELMEMKRQLSLVQAKIYQGGTV